VPSADMAWNKESMDATFLLSNIAPMLETFNDGIWLELEHNIRDWSRAYKEVTVIAGPVFDDPITTIGKNEVLVPKMFFKSVLTYDKNEPKVIGFLFDQTSPTYGRLEDYVVSIDSIEKVTGLDLFSNLYGDWDKEIALEKTNSSEWNFNEKWYLERVNN
jgi:endonuclease G